jgi:hypothetical protein
MLSDCESDSTIFFRLLWFREFSTTPHFPSLLRRGLRGGRFWIHNKKGCDLRYTLSIGIRLPNQKMNEAHPFRGAPSLCVFGFLVVVFYRETAAEAEPNMLYRLAKSRCFFAGLRNLFISYEFLSKRIICCL